MAEQAPSRLDPGFDAEWAADAATVLWIAREEAQKRSHGHAATAHVLLALLKARNNLGARLLGELGVTYEALDPLVSSLRWPEPTRREPPFSPGLQRALEDIREEGRRLQLPSIATDLLLVGLVANSKSSANQVLAPLGVSADAVRAAVGPLFSPALQRNIPTPEMAGSPRCAPKRIGRRLKTSSSVAPRKAARLPLRREDVPDLGGDPADVDAGA